MSIRCNCFIAVMRLLVAPTAPLLLCALLAAAAHAILVAPSSQCAVQCGNVLSSTSGSDLTCADSAYAGTVAGQTFQSCIACELNSTYVDPTTKLSDLQALLCAYYCTQIVTSANLTCIR